MVDFARKLKEVMEKKEISISSFGKKLGINKSIYHYVENSSGKVSVPSAQVIGKVLECFPDINPYWLLLDDGPMFKSEMQEMITKKYSVEDTVAYKEKYFELMEDHRRVQNDLIECMKRHVNHPIPSSGIGV